MYLDNSQADRLQELNKLSDMFGSEGWQFFMREVALARDYMLKNAPETADTNDEWQFLRGQLDGFDTMLKYQQVNEAEMKELMNLAANGPDAYADVNPLEM